MPLFKFSHIDSGVVVATVVGERPTWSVLFENSIIGLTCDVEAELPEYRASADGNTFAAAFIPFLVAHVRQQDVAEVTSFFPQWSALATASVYGISEAAANLPLIIAEIIGENTAVAILPRLDATCLSTVSGVSEVLAVLPHHLGNAAATVNEAGNVSAFIPFISAQAVSTLLGGAAFISAEIPPYAARLSGLSGSYNFGSEDDEVLKYASSRRYI
ncbi:hypothetical protein LLG39_08875 [bacterium]|nr:hypothetical protein [bacterium]